MNYECLIIDDEKMLADSTAEYFNLFGIRTTAVYSAAQCRSFLEENTAELLLLDINLGDGSGFGLCREIREKTDIPILFLSARSSDDDKIAALHIGGDDYIQKPCSLGVLLAKVKAVLKRYGSRRWMGDDGAYPEGASGREQGQGRLEEEPPGGWDFRGRAPSREQAQGRPEEGKLGGWDFRGRVPGRDQAQGRPEEGNLGGWDFRGRAPGREQAQGRPEEGKPGGWGSLGKSQEDSRENRGYADGRLRVDFPSRQVWVEGKSVKLTSLEFRLLSYLIRNRDRVAAKQELFENVWEDKFTGDGTLNVHIRRLREAIERNPGKPEYILTVWGDGYRFQGGNE